MTERVQSWEQAVDALASTLRLSAAIERRGVLVRLGDGVAVAQGLAAVGYEEMVELDCGALAMAYELAPDSTGLVLLSEAERARAGEGATPLGRVPSVPVSDLLLGRVVDPLGRPLDGGPRPQGRHLPVFRAAPELRERAAVEQTLHTGILAIDAAIPIGRGQRQLIVGDRNVGKTALALDIVAAQRDSDVLCVYVLVGQPMSRVMAIRDALAAHGVLDRTVVVAADAATTHGLQYLAPYAGTTVAEHFRESGRHALIVYDDLTKHADTYRELALLLGRPPGREAFPGDIFCIHAELLERATALRPELGGGSITALPLVETTDSDISSYIPTNLISITDGQIYLDAARFERNLRPAIDVGKSVSRIGGVAQSVMVRKASRSLRIVQARFESVESLTRFGFDVDTATRTTVDRGRVLRELLRQPRFSPRSTLDHVVTLTSVAEGWLDSVPPAEARGRVERAIELLERTAPEISAVLERGLEPSEGWKDVLRASFGGAPEVV